MSCVDAKHFVQTTQHALDDLNEFSPHHLRLRLVQVKDAAQSGGEQGEHPCTLEESDTKDAAAALNIKLEPRGGQTPELHLEAFREDATLYYSDNQLSSQ